MEKVKTINVTNMYELFLNCRNLKSINTKGFDTRNVENMDIMFNDCLAIEKIYVGTNWKIATSNTDMFKNCKISTTTLKN